MVNPRSTSVLLIVAAVAVAAGGDGAPAYRLDPARVGWQALTFEASKLLIKARTEVRFALLPRLEAEAELVAEDGAVTPSGATVARITLDSTMRKRRSIIDAWLDAGDARALQQRSLQTGHKPYQRTDRFTAGGVGRHRLEPRDEPESKLGPGAWSVRKSGRQPWTVPAPAAGLVVTQPAALFYLVTSDALARPGDRLEVLAYSRRKLHRLTLEVKGAIRLRARYDEERSGETSRRDGEVEALEIAVHAVPLGEAEESDFRFLGLSGDVSILLEPATRLPLEVRGRIPIAGRVRVVLRRVVWKV